MTRRLTTFVVGAFALVVLGGCEDKNVPGAATARGVSIKHEQAFDGYVVPINATELRAPQNSFRIGSWNSRSSWIKLVQLKEDGEAVKEGDVVAKFEFPGDRARTYVDDEIRKAEASRDQSGVSHASEVDALTAEERKRRIDAERAELDTRRRGVVSERDWELAKITHRQAVFDADATAQHRDAVKRALRAEAAFHDRDVDRAHSLQTRFELYTKLFEVRASHDGVLRHAIHRRRGRKVQKGDGMPSGMHFASLAKDKAVWVQFFVPEASWTALQGATEFVVEPTTAKVSLPVTVEKIEQFPQELGFLKNDDKLPNAREKAYVIWAKFEEQPEGLGAGVEVRVRKR